jgi:hypothetical protein
MTLRIDDPETVKLAVETAGLTGESEAEAIRAALEERRARLRPKPPRRRPSMGLHEWLEREVWPLIPEQERDRPPMTKAERAQILGYGPADD